MAVLANRAAVATSTVDTGTVTLGAALSDAFCTFAEAGVSDGAVVTYLITEGNDFEMGRGTYTATGTTLSRDTVLLSKIGGTSGTTKMTLAGSAEVRIAAAAEDMNDRFRVLAASAVAVSHTGDTIETTLATITVPAGAMGPDGVLRITNLWSMTNNANSKTARTRFGGNVFRTSILDNLASTREQVQIHNRNSASSQVGASLATGNGGWGNDGSAPSTGTADTTASTDITLAVTLGTTTDTITLEAYLVELLYQP